MVLYLDSAAAKLEGDLWVQGTALYYILGVSDFNQIPTFMRWITVPLNSPIISPLLTYLAMTYQIGFVFVLFSKRLHLIWVVAGIFFHIGIATIMGLVPFSIILISFILFTVTDDEWKFITLHVSELQRHIGSTSKS